MAKSELLMPFIQKWEGGYANNPNDKGGCTMKGITIKTYRKYFGEYKTCSDLKNITEEQWLHIFENGYWNPCKGDDIIDQSIANIIVDWAWMSGVKTAIKKIQKIIGVEDDGIVGKQTLNAINSFPPDILFEIIYNERKKYYYNICENNPSQEVFLKGWMNRLNDMEYI
jgi:lysozyme family protein